MSDIHQISRLCDDRIIFQLKTMYIHPVDFSAFEISCVFVLRSKFYLRVYAGTEVKNVAKSVHYQYGWLK